MANSMANVYLGDIVDMHGRAARFLDDDVLDVAQSPDHPYTTNDILLCMCLQNVACGIRIVVRHGEKYLVQRKVVFTQEFRLDEDLILLDIPPLRVDVDHSRNTLKHRADDPVLHRSLLDQFPFNRCSIQTGIGRPFQIVLVHLSESGAVRRHHRFRSGR